MAVDGALAKKLGAILPHLNEKQRRLMLAAEARALGHGGITRVAQAAGVSRPTIHRALRELDDPVIDPGRIRRPGGGRKRTRDRDPGVVAALDALVDPETRGDPMSPLRWTCKSTRHLAQALGEAGHPVSHSVVADMLRALGYSLQAPSKRLEGTQHPDRDAQFRYLNDQVQAFLTRGYPVVSVDAKKKELVGAFRNGGREWQPTGEPESVQVHDFMDRELGKAVPYGIYDVGRNTGWVTVGQDHDTASFAVATLRRWWDADGVHAYPEATELLISADCGGSNGYRVRLWKAELQRFADATGIRVTVCHLPPGTSKWNKIEHRLFSYLTMNWRGRPLISHEVILELIGATTTRTGLRVQAELDSGRYPLHVKVSDQEMAAVQLTAHTFHGEWNYTISPTSPRPTAVNVIP